MQRSKPCGRGVVEGPAPCGRGGVGGLSPSAASKERSTRGAAGGASLSDATTLCSTPDDNTARAANTHFPAPPREMAPRPAALLLAVDIAATFSLTPASMIGPLAQQVGWLEVKLVPPTDHEVAGHTSNTGRFGGVTSPEAMPAAGTPSVRGEPLSLSGGLEDDTTTASTGLRRVENSPGHLPPAVGVPSGGRGTRWWGCVVASHQLPRVQRVQRSTGAHVPTAGWLLLYADPASKTTAHARTAALAGIGGVIELAPMPHSTIGIDANATQNA